MVGDGHLGPRGMPVEVFLNILDELWKTEAVAVILSKSKNEIVY